MAWQVKYEHQWYSDKEDLLKVEILTESYTPPLVELKGQPNPFIIEYPTKDVFDPIKAGGAVLNLLLETENQIAREDLLSGDLNKWRVRYYKNGIQKWFGYLDPRQLSEPYTESENYPITLYANDGLNLLDRIQFLQSDGSNYSGFMTQWEIIQIILGKWGLLDNVTSIIVGLSTYLPPTTYGTGETVLTKTVVNTQNYYDEDNKPMSCREVLDAILRPYGASIKIVDSGIMITDVNQLAGGGNRSANSQNVYLNDFTPMVTGTANVNWNDINDIGIYQTGGTYSVTPRFSGVTVKYSKYKAESPEDRIQDTSQHISASSWEHLSGSNDYYRQLVPSHSDWTFNGAMIYGIKKEYGDEPEYLIPIIKETPAAQTFDPVATTVMGDVYFNGDFDYYLKISGKMKPYNLVDPYNSQTAYTDIDPDAVLLGMQVSVGDYTYNTGEYAWQLTSGMTEEQKYIPVFVGGGGSVMNIWSAMRTLPTYGIFKFNDFYYDPWPTTAEDVLIGMTNNIQGLVTISFSNKMAAMYHNRGWWGPYYGSAADKTDELFGTYVKDLKVDVVKRGTLDSDDNDIEFVGNLESPWFNSTKTVTLYHGNSSSGSGTPMDKAALLYDNSGITKMLTKWSRQNVTGSVEELLLNSIISNISGSVKEIEVTLNCDASFPSTIVVDETYHTGSVFLSTGATVNPSRHSCLYQLKEIKKDEHTI